MSPLSFPPPVGYHVELELSRGSDIIFDIVYQRIEKPLTHETC